MILADTSVWIAHFRSETDVLERLLNHGDVLMHPLVIAELAMGSLQSRQKTLRELDRQPQITLAHTEEVRAMVESRGLYGRGIGFLDAHLLASVLIEPPALLWTKDKRLREAAKEMGVNASFLDDVWTVH